MDSKKIVESVFTKSLRALDSISPSLAAEMALHLFIHPLKHKRPQAESELLKQGRRRVFQNNIVGWEFGEGSSTVLFAHGWSGRGGQFRKFIPSLVERSYRVVVIDAPAHGESPGSETTLKGYAIKLAEVADELGNIECVVGHSFGAGASALALKEGMEAHSIVLIASPSYFFRYIQGFLMRLKLSPSGRKSFIRRLESKAKIKAEAVRLDEQLKGAVQNVLIIHDLDDEAVPIDDAYQIQKSVPWAELFLTKGWGHYRILKSPEVVEKLVSFLDENKKQKNSA